MMSEKKMLPDVEQLRYHGTKEKPDIKIFVSHRIDQDSITIENPLYIPVRCGAVYDERTLEEIGGMLGDDTGDNISEKRLTFNELTVEYWAWKNVRADYYGICHYRRFLSYIDKKYNTQIENNRSGLVYSYFIEDAVTKFKLNDEELMRTIIKSADVISIEPFDTKIIHYNSLLEMMKGDIFHYDIGVVETILKIIHDKFPEKLKCANEYLNQSYIWQFNLFVIKKDIYFDFCKFQFDILFELEEKIDISHFSKDKKRILGYIGEHLLGIYLFWLKQQNMTKMIQLQGVFIENPTLKKPILPAFITNSSVIVFATSDEFSIYLGVALKSLLDYSKPSNNYDIIILEKVLPDNQKKRLKQLFDLYPNFSIRFINVAQAIDGINFYLPTNELSEETYYSILVPWVLKKYEKALVLDCDIIFKEDIAELFKIDIKKYYLAAAKEIVYNGFLNNPMININNSLTKYTVDKLGLKDPYDYFNAGVLLMNLEAFRQNFTLSHLLDLINKNNFNVVEQDLLNMICATKVLFLDYSWNFMSCISPATEPNLNLAYDKEKTLYDIAKKHPKILHYITGMKPWRYPELAYSEDWWSVARKTIFYEMALGRMIDYKIGTLHSAVYDLQRHVGFYDKRSNARKFADKMLPKGSRRRKIAKFFVPKDSLRWKFCKQIYYFFKPQYRPTKE